MERKDLVRELKDLAIARQYLTIKSNEYMLGQLDARIDELLQLLKHLNETDINFRIPKKSEND